MEGCKGSPAQGLAGATLGFFVGFAAVSLFGPTVKHLQGAATLSPALAGLLISIPSLSGSLLRIPFSALVDTQGGRRPFLILLALSITGLAGIYALLSAGAPLAGRLFPLLLLFGVLGGAGIATFSAGISQTAYWFPLKGQGLALGTYAGVGNLAPGIFAFLLSGVALPRLGLAGSYLAWLVLLAAGTLGYFLLGRDAWYFQLRRRGLPAEEAARQARSQGQELFPRSRVSESLRASAAVWQTWVLVLIYFTTFGGFIALTAWLPKYFQSLHGAGPAVAGSLTAGFSVLASLTRVAGGRLSDRLGGVRAAGLGLLAILAGAALITASLRLPAALGGLLLTAVGMGLGNAAVFKLVPQEVPTAVSGAAGWIGGLGALGGFVIPNLLAAFVSEDRAGHPGYARGYLVLLLLGLLSLGLLLLLRRAARRRVGA